MVKSKNPKPEEIQREFEEFVQQRFGDSVQIFSSKFEPGAEGGQEDKPHTDRSVISSFNYTPQDIKAYLDQYVIKQDEAKKALAIAVCDHYHHAKHADKSDYVYAKQNVLLLGPTGVGKTYLVKKIAELIGVPFVKADATRFSETGYVGANVDDLVRDLVAAADDDLDKARFGIIYLDEADKIASRGKHNSPSVSSRGVQFGLLRLMEDCDVDLKAGNDMQSQMQIFMDMQSGRKKPSKINTRHILFIVSGAFAGLGDIIERRLNRSPIGFHRDGVTFNEDVLFHQASTEDFLEFGYEAEFIGRLPVRVSCDPLNEDDLENILINSKDSILEQYKHSFGAYGIHLSFSPESLKGIAHLACKEGTGARSLMTVCEGLMRHYKFELPSTGIDSFVFTKEMVTHPERELRILMESTQDSVFQSGFDIIDQFQESFGKATGVIINLENELRKSVIKKCHFKTERLDHYLKDMFKGYEHGLALMKSRYGTESVVISVDALEQPQKFLEDLITKTYEYHDKKARSLDH